jgi:L-Ala-D/L-Glu epimerase
VLVVVTLIEGDAVGRGEACPLARYRETPDSVQAQIQQHTDALEAGLERTELRTLMGPGAARNAVDCALWDLEAKLTGWRAWELAGLTAPQGSIQTVQTIGLDTPPRMAERARSAWSPLLKLILGGEGDVERVAAVRAAVPAARLIVDVNEGWNADQLKSYPQQLARLGVELIEQPLPTGMDALLDTVRGPIPFAADESFHQAATIDDVIGRYQWVNIKLDKTGGSTEALLAMSTAEQMGMRVMVGCMGGTSLSIAPALLLAENAALVDLDAPPFLERDRSPGLLYERGTIGAYGPELWG